MYAYPFAYLYSITFPADHIDFAYRFKLVHSIVCRVFTAWMDKHLYKLSRIYQLLVIGHGHAT